MTKIKPLKANFVDKRGKIADIFVNSPKDHCSYVTFNRKAIRGNHYHKKSTQYSLIIDGKLELYYSTINKINNRLGKINKVIVKKNTLITHEPYDAHAFREIGNGKAVIFAFSCGLRGGEEYESDTYRLKKKLI